MTIQINGRPTNRSRPVKALHRYVLTYSQKLDEGQMDGVNWHCMAEDYDHAVEQLLDAEPDAFNVEKAAPDAEKFGKYTGGEEGEEATGQYTVELSYQTWAATPHEALFMATEAVSMGHAHAEVFSVEADEYVIVADITEALPLYGTKSKDEPEQDPEEAARHEKYREAARAQYEDEGTLEIDEGALVSEGCDPGAYVQAWVWVYNDAAGIPDEDDEEEDLCEDCEHHVDACVCADRDGDSPTEEDEEQ